MPESHFDDPNYYRNWAEEIRTLVGRDESRRNPSTDDPAGGKL
jgi:hypothetical protein